MPLSYLPLDKLLRSHELVPADDFSSIVNLAWRAQQHRSRNKNSALPPDANVSRTSLLFACAELTGDIQITLTAAKLDYHAFCKKSGLSDFDRDEHSDVSTIPVSGRMDEGLQAYLKACPDQRNVGAWELAYAIAVIGGDSVDRRFSSAGGDLNKAADLILEQITNTHATSPAAATIDLGRFPAQEHVTAAVQTALTLAGSEPVNARHLLTAAVIVGKTAHSKAYDKLAELLNLTPPDANPASADLKVIPVSDGVEKSFAVAVPFLEEEEKVWGRDYVTLALLAADDPSLDEVEWTAGKELASIRDEWFIFLVEYTRHRPPESWKEWWRAAGVTPPADAPADAPPSSNVPAHVPLDPPTHQTLLLTWNPKMYAFEQFAELAEELKQQGEVTMGWSSGNRTSVSIGDRVFLMRQGEAPKGIVGSGWVAGAVERVEHFDVERKAKGDKFNRIEVKWETLGEYPILTRDELNQFGSTTIWDAASGGVEIAPDIAQRLEAAYEKARHRDQPRPPDVIPPRAFLDTDAIPSQVEVGDFKLNDHDSLDVKAQAKIFSTLLIAKDVQPPFALGLLGDWGVGKTFFMRLMQENVESVAGRDAQADGSSDSVTRAAQIEFNAWHFVDSDLWASLASHIFDRLSRQLRGPNDSEGKADKIRRVLRQIIHSSKREQQEANAVIDAAVIARQDAARDLVSNQAERRRAATDCEEHRLVRVWRAVLAVKPDKNISEQADWPDFGELKSKAEKTAKRFGVDETIDSVKSAEQAYTSLREVSRRGAGLAAAFVQDFTGTRAVGWVLLVLMLMVLLLVWPWLLSLFSALPDPNSSQQPDPNDFVTMLLTPLLRLGTILGPVALWAGARLKAISSALGYLERIRSEIRNPRLPLADPRDTEKNLQTTIEALDAKIATGQSVIEEADRQITAAQAEIQRINSGGLVYDFLMGRVHDSKYLDRLGLISVIRKDFEELGGLLKDWRKHAEDHSLIEPGDSSKTPPIERIILYIDDLDRCPPKRVVEVLQAVHLILAFDLFVVVVAVDPRWLERSLNEEYNPSQKTSNGSQPEDSRHRFDAHNYLEKIFQIPYALPKMNEGGYRNLVADMVSKPQQRAKAEKQRLERERIAEEEKGIAEEEPLGEDMELPGRKPRERQTADQRADNVESAKQDEEQLRAEEAARKKNEEEMLQKKELEEEEARLAAEQAAREEAEKKAAGQRIEAMMLSPAEEEFMLTLFCFINTPRLGKRFVNIYRLIRVRASETEVDFANFTDPDRGEFRAVLMLLAISIGRTGFAPKLLAALDEAKEEKVKKFRPWLEASFPDQPPQNVNADVGKVVAALTELKGPTLEERLKPYCKWASEVGRYSFDWRLDTSD